MGWTLLMRGAERLAADFPAAEHPERRGLLPAATSPAPLPPASPPLLHTRRGPRPAATSPAAALAILAIAAGALAAAEGCSHAECDEYHDPACWIPTFTDAGADGDAEDEGGNQDATVDAGPADALPSDGGASG